MLKYEDGYTTDEAAAAENLIIENEMEYINSAIFSFFRGRVERMKVLNNIFCGDKKKCDIFSHIGQYICCSKILSIGL